MNENTQFKIIIMSIVILFFSVALYTVNSRLDTLENDKSFFRVEVCDQNTSTCTSFDVKQRSVELTQAVNSHEERLRAVEDFLNAVIEAQQQETQTQGGST